MPRLFIAIPIDGTLAKRLSELSLLDQGPWRRVRAEALHLTLVFLGETAEALTPRVIEAMNLAAATTGPLILNAEGLGGFPNERRAHVLWTAVTGDVEPLARLQSDLAARLLEGGVKLQDRRYRPHITLARSRVPRPPPASPDSNARLGQWHATEIQLIESYLRANGPRYEVRASATLESGS